MTTPTTAPETTGSLLDFGDAVLAVLRDYTHMPIRGLRFSHPHTAVVSCGDPYSFVAAYNLAVWAQALHQPIRFQRPPLAVMLMRATLGGIRFEFEAAMHAGMVDEFERRAGVFLEPACELAPADVIAALGDHPAVRAANL